MDAQPKKGSQSTMLIVGAVVVIVIIVAAVVLLMTRNNATSSNNSTTGTQNNTLGNNPVNFNDTSTNLGTTNPNADSTLTTTEPTAISIDHLSFPASVTIKKGQTVVWTNNDTAPHNVTFDSINVSSSTLNPGGTFSHVFDQTGTFTYKCTLHPFMTAKIVVTE